ncbi:hypothetical protein EYZ11_000870 [Aspergillus tanneri]|uniref:Uncharacterized protein n=1 Tax=Aspergillus tanneri TaxID=1220188 RepID=A0A4S3JW26_9EURO|nr:hypothetical protein EYZ11_000870 [Aspergillus tanneri]
MDPVSRTAQIRSRLELLPVEIIQLIFLHSLEFNLPRASPYISRMLSNTVIYTWLIRLAFSSANESSKHGYFTADFLPPPLDFWALSAQERRDLQSDILECGWFTLPLIRKCQREYMEQVVRHKLHDLDFCPDDLPALDNIGRQYDNLEGCDKGLGGIRGKGDLILRAKDRATKKEERVALWFHYGALLVRPPKKLYDHLDIFQLPWCSVDWPPRIPDRLLSPPWTETKLEFLRLFSTSAYIDEDSTFPRSKRVLRQVIRDRDLATFEQLVKIFALKHADERDDPFIKILVDQRWEDIPAKASHLKEQLMSKAGV